MLRFSLLTLLLLAPIANLAAQEVPTSPVSSDGLNLMVDGAIRFRGIRRSGEALFAGDDTRQADVLASIGIGATWDAYLKGYLEFDARAVDAGEEAELHMQQGWVDFEKLWFDSKLRVGRFGIAFGDERIASEAIWWSARNTFDGVRVDGGIRNVSWSAWASEARTSAAALGDEGFHGAWLNWKMGELSMETYVVQLHNPALLTSEWTYGMRWFGETYPGLDWNLHSAIQLGHRGETRVSANAFALDLDYELDGGHHIGMTWSRASGNEDDGDTRNETFHAPFGDDMRYFGRATFATWSNLSSLSMRYRLDWNQRWSMHTDLHSFSREESLDAFRLGPQAQAPFASDLGGSKLANELDFYLTGNLTERLNLDFGVSVVRPSESISPDSTQSLVWLLTNLQF